ncbi:tetratricopeptide repeat protein [Sandaracinobacteroides saxicola]|uniref:Tetratricopeptide repeat protein n=1 Tax=Sandaracinobacteroides saxicola TaxID=2759707 RepID=A0A7G5ILK0_9SPHN|nr:tetratricopeptide repeat protein [Sandaracinobacteroides saxicola]QMW24242.1 tetratricopeptide repeat protein [Sandaracinobacteroides saxicola]
MRTGLGLVAVALACGQQARAAEQVQIAPAPAWVVPVVVPASDEKQRAAPIELLLADRQLLLERGKVSSHTGLAMRINTPQGLAAGNISLPWRPETDVLTVHRLVIRRGDKVIDVLADQRFTVIRREQNLENAVLDGVLTANIQPEGLQVGDVLELAATVVSSDPVLGGRVEAVVADWNGLPVGRAHFRAQWPAALKVRLRQDGALPPLKPATANGRTVVALTLDGLMPEQPPKGAPLRYRYGRQIELTDFASWAEPAALLAPLYRKAAALPADGALMKEVERIRQLSPDPVKRAEAALALVQDRIRYVALAMGQGGLVPADAEVTWSRRYGDCKGKTVLLIGLLQALGITAEPVAVNVATGDGIDARLPMIGLFNHVLVRATIGDRSYWMDGTRQGDGSLARLRVPYFRWGLPLVERGATLVRMVPPPLTVPDEVTTIRMDARAGLAVPAPTTIEVLTRGDDAIGAKLGFAAVTEAARDQWMRDYWKRSYDFIEVKSMSQSFDAATGEHRLRMEGLARMDWSSGWYETDGTGVGYKADFRREPGPDRDAPFAVGYPVYEQLTQTILLPPGFPAMKADGKNDISETVAGREYRRTAFMEGSTFTVVRSERTIAPEFPAAEAPAAEERLRALAKETLYLRRPNSYRLTDAELKLAMAEQPTTVEALLERGGSLLDAERFDDALADFERAVTMQPNSAEVLAARGLAKVWKRDFAGARKDLDAAAALKPDVPRIFHARGVMADFEGKPADAVAAYSRALELKPNNSFALGRRAYAQQALGKTDAALSDAAQAIKLSPRWSDLYLLRANILRRQGKTEAAIAEATALMAANPEDAYAHAVAGSILAAFDRREEAMKAFDRAIAIRPDPYFYLARSARWLPSEKARKLADLDAALKLNPGYTSALAAKAETQADAGDIPGALATLDAALKTSPDDRGLLTVRGLLLAKKGDMARATKDFAAVSAKTTDATELNNLCWEKATAGVALAMALEECDRALKLAPGIAGFLDSRGMVLLRLGRLDEAIADYGKALAQEPDQAESLYGRAVAWARKGERAKSDADAAAAIKRDPKVKERFEGYGLTR